MYAFRAFVALILFAALGVRSNPVESVVVPHEFCESADLLIVTAVRPSHKCGPAPLVVTNPGRVLQITAAINASWCMTHIMTRPIIRTLISLSYVVPVNPFGYSSVHFFTVVNSTPFV